MPLGSVWTSCTFNFMVLFQNKSQKLRFGCNEDTVSLLHPNFCNLDITGDPGLHSGAGWVNSVEKLCGDCTKIVHSQCRCCAVSAASARKSYRARATSMQRLRRDRAAAVPFWACRFCVVSIQGLCNATYDMSMGYGLEIFSNLYNFPLNKIVEAAAPLWKSHCRLLPTRGGCTERRMLARYRLHRPIVGKISNAFSNAMIM